MNNQELRDILIAELGIGELPEEAQNEVVAKLGDVILKSLTVTIFEKLPQEARTKFETVSASGNDEDIQFFLNENIPELHTLMETEVRRVLQSYREGDIIDDK